MDVCCVLGRLLFHPGTMFLQASMVENAWRRQAKRVWKSDVRSVLKLFARLGWVKVPVEC